MSAIALLRNNAVLVGEEDRDVELCGCDSMLARMDAFSTCGYTDQSPTF
jgi:hypothetical protein